jgi:arsenate reductase (thioredoxin)
LAIQNAFRSKLVLKKYIEKILKKIKNVPIGDSGAMNHTINEYLDKVRAEALNVPQHRQVELKNLIAYVVKKKAKCGLLYVCTHNSRRSQMAQVWSFIISRNFGFHEVRSFSAGTEETAFDRRALDALDRAGVVIEQMSDGNNPQYRIHSSDDVRTLLTFSKLIEDPINPHNNFASIMTCSTADDNCPVILESDEKISLRFADPKASDGTPEETQTYDERCLQIATELMFVFGEVKKQLA